MAIDNSYLFSGYSLNQPLASIFPAPIVAKRNPAAGDMTPVGQLWVNVVTNSAFILTSVTGGAADWVGVGGGAGMLTSLTVNPGNITATAGNIVATAGNLSAGGSVAAGTTVTAGTGITATAGNITASLGNLVATVGDVSAGTTVTAGTGITATNGNITASNGDFVLSAAGTYLSLPGPVFVMSGAGAPAGGLALHIGDLYLNTAAVSAVTRIYVATAVGVWTNVTCAA